MVHLIGVEHKIQYKNPTWGVTQAHRDNWDRYSSIIEQSICNIKPAVVAEELNEKWLEGKNGAKSILKFIKEEHEARTGTKILHIFAEPDSIDKSAKGYKDRETIEAILSAKMQVEPTPEQIMAHVIAHQHPIRENLWLDTIWEHICGELIFVCGDIHLYTFRKLLKEKRIDSRIIAQGIGVDCSCLADYKGLNFALANDMFDETDCFCLKG
jgi:hypothetical protein